MKTQSAPATKRTRIHYTTMFHKVASHITDLFSNDKQMSKDYAEMLLKSFEMTHGKDAVKAMYGFMRYCETMGDKRFTPTAIKSVFVHDLNGGGVGWLPRTHGYLKYWNATH